MIKFRLVRYFTLASLAAFLAVVVLLALVQRNIAIGNMISQAQSNNVDLARTFANSLWDDFRPFVLEAGAADPGSLPEAPQQIELRRQVLDLMRGLSVVKVKVYDLAGLTVFSTDSTQIGENKHDNAGFISARGGGVASELTHRDAFSAFEETIEDRDVLSSYIPIVNPRSGLLEGVFEIYTDVTPFLADIQSMTWTLVGVVVAALVFLFAVLFLIVRRADHILGQQAEENTRAQLQIAQAEKMASLGQMVAGVAHELNTPLAFTRSNVSMLLDFMDELRLPLKFGNQLIRRIRDTDEDPVNVRVRVNARLRERMFEIDEDLTTEQLQQMLLDTLRGLEQMSELVVHLREFTRIDRARIAEYDVNKGVRNVIYIARGGIPDKIRFETDLADIPPLQCMPSQMNQILINLINNAAQSIEDDDGVITIRTGHADGRIRIEVEDNGCGIPDEVRQHMFEPFFTTRGSGERTGLGLSIVRDIVEEHGGSITVESSPGMGSRFIVLFPLQQPLEQPLAA